MSEPDWSMPMNRSELIARIETLEAELAQAQARVTELSDLKPQTMKQRIAELESGPFVLFAEHEAELKIQDDANDILERRVSELAAELANQQEDYAQQIALDDESRAAVKARIARYESALTLLTNGYKYSTEVVRIARKALGEKHG